MNLKKGKKKRCFKKILLYLFLILLVAAMVFPLLWMFSAAFKVKSEIFHFPPTLIPKNPTFSNFLSLFERFPFGRNLLNSAFVASSAAALSLFFCSLAAFSFAKYRFRGRDFLFLFLLGTMLIPYHVTLIPLFIFYRRIHWIDKFWGLIFPGMANAFGIFFMRQYMFLIPDELLDSARIDGCSDFRIFLQIILPMSRPALTALGVIFFMASWNNFLWPLILLKSDKMLTAVVAIRQLQGVLRVPYDLIMAASALTVIPLIILFLVLQKQFIAGITKGAIKG
ncbi:carbohydrate ABC transporter permease [Candidatus Aerophobetes bacterium]|nr:carbohydrate ABC transporter permease [Candidatus Aerophobetes bacterium]